MDNLLDFSGQVALVTGGSRGLGEEMALALAERGADVIITSRKADACEEVEAGWESGAGGRGGGQKLIRQCISYCESAAS